MTYATTYAHALRMGEHPKDAARVASRTVYFDGQRVCADPCVTVSAPQPINPPADRTGD